MAGFNLSKCVSRGGAVAHMAVAAAFTLAWLVPNSTESAVANGDTRTITLSNQHTNESGSFTFMVNGVYDSGTLDKLNYFCRDWRLNEPTKMDPHLFDIIWEVYRESGSSQPIDVLSAYRSPQTNAMLRRRSRQVAEHSQHMQGKAIDAHFLDVSTARIRDIAMRAQAGGVGFYPTGNTPWVHIDSGSVRYWPKMSRDALTRLFPDGKTVFIPADGQPMARYQEARAEIEARGGNIQVARGGGIGGIFSWLFGGGGADDAEESGGQEATTATASSIAGARGGRNGGGYQAPEPQVEVAEVGPQAVAKAKRNLPTGQAYASAPEPAPAPKPEAPSRRLTLPMSGRKPSPRPSATCRPSRLTPAPQSQRRRRQSSRRRSRSWSSPILRATPRQMSRVARGRRSSRRCRRGSQPISPLSHSPRSHAANSAGGTRPCFGYAAARPSPRPRTRGLVPPRSAACCRRSSPPVSTGRRLARLRWPKGSRRAPYDDSELLARAAALTAPLPPMPIPGAAAALAPAPVVVAAAAPSQADHGWVARTASAAAEDLAQLFGGVFKSSSPAETSPGELRASQQ